MAKVKGGLESMLSGKFGNMVFVQRQGKTYMRSAPTRTKDSSTPAMLLNQKRFGEVMKFCGLFKSTVIPQIWNSLAVGTSGFRLFQKTNSPAFGPDGTLKDPKLLMFSKGKLALPMGIDATSSKVQNFGRVEITTIQVSWLKDGHSGGLHLKDELLVISAADGKYSAIMETGILRGNLKGSFELPQRPIAATHIYLFFNSMDHINYSESVCFEI